MDSANLTIPDIRRMTKFYLHIFVDLLHTIYTVFPDQLSHSISISKKKGLVMCRQHWGWGRQNKGMKFQSLVFQKLSLEYKFYGCELLNIGISAHFCCVAFDLMGRNL